VSILSHLCDISAANQTFYFQKSPAAIWKPDSFVMPAKAGIQGAYITDKTEIPAFAGMAASFRKDFLSILL
jgi:hypothetical protein